MGKCEHINYRVPLVVLRLPRYAGDKPLVPVDHYCLTVSFTEALLSCSAVGSQEEIRTRLRHQLGVYTGNEGGIGRAPVVRCQGRFGIVPCVATTNVNPN